MSFLLRSYLIHVLFSLLMTCHVLIFCVAAVAAMDAENRLKFQCIQVYGESECTRELNAHNVHSVLKAMCYGGVNYFYEVQVVAETVRTLCFFSCLIKSRARKEFMQAV